MLPPLAWQDKIADARRNVSASSASALHVASELDALLPSLLDRAFRGGL
jgi:hypothetical protein